MERTKGEQPTSLTRGATSPTAGMLCTLVATSGCSLSCSDADSTMMCVCGPFIVVAYGGFRIGRSWLHTTVASRGDRNTQLPGARMT